MSSDLRRRVVSCLIALGCLSATAQAQAEYPTRPVQIVAPTGPGLMDTITRIAASALERELGGRFVVVNRPGASGAIGASMVARSDPDGYTLLLSDTGVLTINDQLYKDLPFDPHTAFAPISLVAKWPLVLAVPGESRFHSTADFIAAAREQPGKLFYSSPGKGTGGHIATELFLSRARISATHVPYKGSAAAVAAAAAGDVNMIFTNLLVLAPFLKSGRLRALGVAGEARLEAIPEVPTMAEGALPVEAYAWFGLVAPSKTPPAIVDRLSRALTAALARPDVQKRTGALGVHLAGSSPAEFARYIQSEREHWGRVLRQAGITAD